MAFLIAFVLLVGIMVAMVWNTSRGARRVEKWLVEKPLTISAIMEKAGTRLQRRLAERGEDPAHAEAIMELHRRFREFVEKR